MQPPRRNRFLVPFNEHELVGFLTQIECENRDGDEQIIAEIQREIEIRNNELAQKTIPTSKG